MGNFTYRRRGLDWLRAPVGMDCFYCGQRLEIGNATWDHLVPVRAGGAHTASNLVSCCGECNVLKGGALPPPGYLALDTRPFRPRSCHFRPGVAAPTAPNCRGLVQLERARARRR